MSGGLSPSLSGSGLMVNADKKRVGNEAEDVSTNGTATTQDVDMKAPNRNNFEHNLSKLNNASSNVQTQLKKYWNASRQAEINLLREEISSFQRNYNKDSLEEKELSANITDHQAKYATKQHEIHDMEGDTDMIYKTLSVAQEKLTMAEDRYKKQNFASVREEKLQVAEIDRIKRNLAKLAKYLPLVEERKSLDATIKDLRQELRLIRSKMRGYQEKMNDCRKKIRELKGPYIDLKKRQYELNEKRRAMIKQYEQDRQNYAVWAQQNRGVSTFPTAMLHDDPFDNFEPFAEHKKTCAKLLRYLRNLKRKCEPVSTSESIVPSSEDAESSADEFPDSFKLLKNGNADTSQSSDKTITYSKKKNYVKKYVKKTLPITHSIDYIRLFSDIEVEFPKTYAELDDSITKVEDVLSFYNDQTDLERLEEMERADSPFSSMISLSGSDLMDTSYLSPRSISSLSNLVIQDDPTQQDNTSMDESNLNFHFPKLRDVNTTRN